MSKTTSSENSDAFYAVQSRHVRQCLKEARIVMLFWFVGLIHCLTMFLTMGYVPPHQRPDVPDLILGMPTWVFWGLFFPWFIQIGLTFWFALCFMKDDEEYQDFPQQ